MRSNHVLVTNQWHDLSDNQKTDADNDKNGFSKHSATEQSENKQKTIKSIYFFVSLSTIIYTNDKTDEKE